MSINNCLTVLRNSDRDKIKKALGNSYTDYIEDLKKA